MTTEIRVSSVPCRKKVEMEEGAAVEATVVIEQDRHHVVESDGNLVPEVRNDVAPEVLRDVAPEVPRDVVPEVLRDVAPEVPRDVVPEVPEDVVPEVPRDVLVVAIEGGKVAVEVPIEEEDATEKIFVTDTKIGSLVVRNPISRAEILKEVDVIVLMRVASLTKAPIEGVQVGHENIIRASF